MRWPAHVRHWVFPYCDCFRSGPLLGGHEIMSLSRTLLNRLFLTGLALGTVAVYATLARPRRTPNCRTWCARALRSIPVRLLLAKTATTACRCERLPMGKLRFSNRQLHGGALPLRTVELQHTASQNGQQLLTPFVQQLPIANAIPERRRPGPSSLTGYRGRYGDGTGYLKRLPARVWPRHPTRPPLPISQ